MDEAPTDMDMGGLETALQQAAPGIGQLPQVAAALTAAQPATPATKPDAPAEKPVDKPAEQKPVDDGTPKKPWEKLEGEAKAEEKTAETTKPDEPDLPEPKFKNQAEKDRFIQHRQEFKTLKQQVPELQTKLAEMQRQLEEARAKSGPDEKTAAELEELRTYRAATEIETTPEWKSTISGPITRVLDNLGKIAERAKVDAKELEAATDFTESWERNLAIQKVFEAAEEAVPAALITAAIQEAEKLHPIYAKGNEMRSKAQEVWQGMKNKSEAEKQAAAQAGEAEYAKSRDHIFEQLLTKNELSALLKDDAIAKAVKAAPLATDPADQAYNAIAGEMVPHLVKTLQSVRAELKKLQDSEKALLGSRATTDSVTTSATTTRTNGDDTEMDLGGLHEAARASGLTGRR